MTPVVGWGDVVVVLLVEFTRGKYKNDGMNNVLLMTARQMLLVVGKMLFQDTRFRRTTSRTNVRSPRPQSTIHYRKQ